MVLALLYPMSASLTSGGVKRCGMLSPHLLSAMCSADEPAAHARARRRASACRDTCPGTCRAAQQWFLLRLQGQEDVRPATLRKSPFIVRRSVAGAALRACIRLQLDESLDPEVHNLAIDYDIAGPSGCREITFTSQQQTYDTSSEGGQSGAAALQAAEGDDSSQGALLAMKSETLDRRGSKEEPDAKRQRTSGSLIKGLPQAKPG